MLSTCFEKAVLDDLSGFEFEDLLEDVFRTLGYENVRQAERLQRGDEPHPIELLDGDGRWPSSRLGVIGGPGRQHGQGK